MAQAASRNFTDLAILRVLSGAFEATADPSFVLITVNFTLEWLHYILMLLLLGYMVGRLPLLPDVS